MECICRRFVRNKLLERNAGVPFIMTDAIMVRFKKLSESARVPEYAHPGDSGMDMFASEDAVVKAGGFCLVCTGVAAAIPDGFEGQVRPRSGLALRSGIFVLNSPGTVDSNYRGELKVILANFGKEDFHVSRGMRIAQLVICRVPNVIAAECMELDETGRGANGFGSSGL